MSGICLGIRTISPEERPEVLRARLERIRRWGYDAVEPLTQIADPEVTGRLSDAIVAAGLAMSGFRTGDIYRRHGYTFSDPDVEVRRSAVKAIKGVIEAATHFPGAKVYNGMIQGKPKPGTDVEQAKRWVAECFTECLDEAARVGVEMCLEPLNHYDLPYHNTVAQVAAFIRRLGSPNLTILIDTFHMNIEERDLRGALLEHAGLIGGAHFMDSTRREPGTGHLDLAGLYATLLEAGYDGYLTVEMDAHPRFDEAAEKSAPYLRAIVTGAAASR